jgi:subtilisin family serine protease
MKASTKINMILAVLFSGIVSSCSEFSEPELLVHNQEVLSTSTRVIPNEYIVRLAPSGLNFRKSQNYMGNQVAMRKYSESLLASYKIAPSNVFMVYSAAVDGFSAYLSPEQVALLKKDSRVISIESDEMIVLDLPMARTTRGGTTKAPKTTEPAPAPTEPAPAPTEPAPVPAPTEPAPAPAPTVISYPVETSASSQEVPWGITRIGGFSTYRGTNVAFVIDTGIDLDHPDLNVLASLGFKAVPDSISLTLDDEHSHGTHVAGTIAAINNSFGVVGVAAGAPVVPIKVMGPTGSGRKSWVIAGIDYVAAVGKPGDVANLSLGGAISSTQDQAILNAAAKGIRFSLAAGNDAADANNYSPGRVNGANIFTISSIDSNGAFSSFSNFGNPPIDFAAPGRSVRSTMPGGVYGSKSGTSMAAPHVAGMLLLNGVRGNGVVTADKDGFPDPIAFRADR